MTQIEKARFRHSKEWQDFRLLCKKASGGVDYITGEPLQRGWELHHLDVTNKGYTNIDNPKDFICLNSMTHTFLHYLFPKLDKLDKNQLDKALSQMFEKFNEVFSEMARREREQ